MSRIYPILSLDEARSYETGILEDDPEQTAAAMEAAGIAIGAAIVEDYHEIRDWPPLPHVLVLAGKGLNTGDAFIACRQLQRSLSRLAVTIVETVPLDNLNPLARDAFKQLEASLDQPPQVYSVATFAEASLPPVDVLIDGLYGLGFRPPLKEEVAELLKSVKDRKDISFRVAIDIPSGIGAEADPDSFEADVTYIPGVAKAPCFDDAHLGNTGRIRFLEIEPFLDQPTAGVTSCIVSKNYYKRISSWRPAHVDKRSYGHCLILAGSPRMPGAAQMSALGSLKSGVGLLTVLTPSGVASQISSAVPEAMWQSLPPRSDGGLDVESVRILANYAKKADALLIGPGLIIDRSTLFTICRIIRETTLPLVLDASALTEDVASAVISRPATSGPVVMTPHAGEFSRMSGVPSDAISDEDLKQFCTKHRCIVVLKGRITKICDGERVILAPVGGPVLARGGSGDILSGMILTQLSQNLENPLEAVLNSVTWHGAAADLLARTKGSVAVRTTELLDYLSLAHRS